MLKEKKLFKFIFIFLLFIFPNAFSDAIQQGVGLEGFEDFTISLENREFFVGDTNNLSITTLETQTEEINVFSPAGTLDVNIGLTDTAKDFNGLFDLTLELQYQDGAETIFYEKTFIYYSAFIHRWGPSILTQKNRIFIFCI